MSRSVLNIESGNSFTVPNSTTPNNIVIWHNTTGTNLGESSISLATQNMSNLNSITLNLQTGNPGGSNTIWIDNETSQLMLGNENLHAIGGDVLGPASSTDGAIARFDGTDGKLLQDSSVCIVNNNLTGVGSVSFIHTGSNPGSDGTVWFNAGAGVLNIGNNEVIDSISTQTLSNKVIVSSTVDASSLQTTSTSVNIVADPPTVGSVLTATSASTAEWQVPSSPETGVVNGIALYVNTSGDLKCGNLKIGGTQNRIKLIGDVYDETLVLIDTEQSNMAFGTNAYANAISGSDNSCFGGSTGYQLVSGDRNIAIGSAALVALPTGNNNIAIGVLSGLNYTGAESNNIIIGNNVSGNSGESNYIRIGTPTQLNFEFGGSARYDYGQGNLSFGTLIPATATLNTSMGTLASNSMTVGAYNVAFGGVALEGCTTGTSNCALGNGAIRTLTTGSSNICIGYYAGSAYTGAETNNLLIGTSITGTLGESNVTRIGFGQTKAFISGVRGVTTTAVDAIPVLISSDGQLGTVSSSIVYKENIEVLTSQESSIVDKLNPVSFNYIEQHGQKKSLGLIAEEVEQVYPDMCVYDGDGTLLTVDYSRLSILLLKEVQMLKKQISILALPSKQAESPEFV